MMDTVFGKTPEGLSAKSSDEAYEDDVLQIPFSATKLRHSLSEGSRPCKPVNGYNRMHSFHSTLADDHWKDHGSLENSKSDSSFLPADFTETLLKDFPRLHKNGYQSHSFDEDIFEEAADKFSAGFFSESEIDDIPRSSLFHRAGLRRSTSHVEPRGGASRQDSKETIRETDEKSSRKAKIEELMRLKKQLEELKSWQANSESKQRIRDNRKDTSREEDETSKDKEEDLLESRLKVIKEKGKMKRRRLSSSKKSNSLSSKLMEELLEEEEELPAEGDIPTPEKDSKSPGKVRTRSSSDIDDYVSPSSLRREPLDESFKLADRLGTKPWQDDFKHSLFNRHEDASVRKKSLEKPLGERKFSLNSDDTASSPAKNCDFRRSYSTSFDLNGIDRDLRDSLAKIASKHSEKDDKSSASDVASNSRWKSQRNDSGLRKDDRHTDACNFHSDAASSSLTSDNFKTSFDLRRERDKSWEGSQQNRKSQERNSKQSLLQDKYEMDDIFRKFTLRGVPRKDFFEHEFFARDDRRKKLMEEIGGIQRHLADITKHELRGRKQRPKQEDKEAGPQKQDLGEIGARSPSIVNLQAERSSLIDHLKQLLCQKQEREQEIRKRLDRVKREESNEISEKTRGEIPRAHPTKEEEEDKENISRCDEDKNQSREPIQRLVDEDEVSFILRSAGAEQYIPITKKNEITIDKLYQFMPADFAELGITNPELQQRLQEEIDKHFVEQKNAQLKAEELDSSKEGCSSKLSDGGGSATGTCGGSSTPCTPIVDAPEGYEPDVPVHVSAECVVCLDRQSNLLFLNCGHVCCCYDCSVDLSLCPLCRAEIAAKLIMNDCLPE